MQFLRQKQKIFYSILLVFLIIIGFFALQTEIYAQTNVQLKLFNPLGSINTFAGLAEAIFRAVVIVAIPLTVIFLIWAGVLFVTARGSEEQITRAKKIFFWAVMGALIIVASWAIALAINNSAKTL